MVNDESLKEEKVIDLTGKEVPYKVLSVLSKEAAEKYQMLIFEKEEKVLKVAMVDPENTEALNALRFIANKLGLELDIFKISEDGFATVFNGYDKADVIVQKAQKDYIKKEKELELEKQRREKVKEEAKAIGTAPITKIVDVILQHAVLGGASDIHIEPQENELRVRYRVDGDLFESFKLSRDLVAALVSRIKIMSNLRIDEKRKPQDGRLKIIMEGRDAVDVRVSTLPTAEGEKVVMRILEKETGLDKFESLGLIGRNQRIIEKGLGEPYGVILVTGPTGSGKSTTIFSCLRKINKLDTNIVTLEDPVEYKIPGVNHSQVNPEIGFTFASGLRSILRQDPDVIMVGEIRDRETAELAIHAALTGHLVLSTLHTNDALGAIPRMVDMGIEPFLLSSSLRVAIGQRLVRRICGNCKEEVEPSERIRQYVLKGLELIPEEERKERLPKGFDPDHFGVWQGKGCPKCKNTGTKGRIAIYEVVECGPEMRKVIDDSLDAASLANEFKRQGATLMREDGILKALNGETTVEAVEEATTEDDIGQDTEQDKKVDEEKTEKASSGGDLLTTEKAN